MRQWCLPRSLYRSEIYGNCMTLSLYGSSEGKLRGRIRLKLVRFIICNLQEGELLVSFAGGAVSDFYSMSFNNITLVKIQSFLSPSVT